MSIVGSNALAGASGQSTGGGGGFRIDRSLRFNSADSAYLSRTPTSAGNGKTWTLSTWVKTSSNGTLLCNGIAGSGNNGIYVQYFSNTFLVGTWTSSWQWQLVANRVFRDPSAWHHVVVAVDTTQSTTSDRVKIYINGVQETSFSTENYPSQNYDTLVNNTALHAIGRYGNLASGYFDGYLADVHFIDGQALAPTDFGEYDSNNVWQPKEFTGTYGPLVDQSQTWTNQVSGTENSTYPFSNVFNNDGQATHAYPANGTEAVFTPSPSFSSATTVKIWYYAPTLHANAFKLNGTGVGNSLSTTGGTNTHTFDVTGTGFTSLSWSKGVYGSEDTGLLRIDVDGKQLVDSTVTVGDNSFYLKFADNSSNAALGKNSAVADDFTPTVGALTTTQAADFYSAGSNPANNLFDGSTSTIVYGGYNSSSTNSDLIWTPNGAYSVSSSLRVYCGYYSTIYVNGVSKATGGQSSAPAWVTLSHTGSITSIKFENTSNANVVRAAAIEIDGTIVETTAWIVNNLTAENALTLPGVSFDGSGDVVSSADHSDFTLGTNDWTIEYFVNPSAFETYDVTVCKYGNSSYAWWHAFLSNGSLIFYLYDSSLNATTVTSTTTFTTNKWAHVAIVRDGNTLRMYVDGVQEDTASITGWTVYDSTAAVTIGEDDDGNYDFSGVISNVRIVNGTCLYTSGTTFTVPTTPLTNVTNTKLLCCQSSSSITAATVAPNTLSSGGNPTATEISDSTSANDSLIDTPTNYEATGSGNNGGNYPTWNPLTGSNQTFSNGNLEITTATNYLIDSATMYTPPGTGKWYWEFVQTARTGTDYTLVGMLPRDSNYVQGSSNIPQHVGGIGLYIGVNGVAYVASGAATAGTTSATFDVGDILGWAFDAENGTVQCYKNGVAQGTQFTNVRTDIGWTFCVTDYDHSTVSTYAINFGQRPFSYTPPTGYKSLCTTNLPDPTIADGSTAFDTKLYNGNGSSQTISGMNFGPDLIWSKIRSSTGKHRLTDSVRGTANALRSDGTDAEFADTNVTAFNSDGFDIGANGNASGFTYVAWAWDAAANSSKTYNVTVVSDSGNKYRFDGHGTSAVTLDLEEGSTYVFDQSDSSNTGHPIRFGTSANGTDYTTGVTHAGTPGSAGAKTTLVLGTGVATLYYSCANHSGMGGQINTNSTAGASNFDGSIQSTVRANPSAGFSICTYTSPNSSSNQNFGHGLNAKPDFVIVKNRDSAYNWDIYHSSLGYNSSLIFTAAATRSGAFSAEPTSSIINTKTGYTHNGTNEYVALCWTAVEGYSAFGSYTGNGSTDGPFVFTGMRTRWLMVKSSSNSGEHWLILDTERDTHNVADATVYANLTNAEAEAGVLGIDILSNGFKCRGTNAGVNASGYTYVYAAFSEHPFKTARAR